MIQPKNDLNGFILAGGAGTRFRPLTLTTPKPLIPVLDKPAIEYSLEIFQSLGIKEAVISLSHLAEKVEIALGDGSRWGMKLYYSIEKTPLGTAGGFVQGLTYFSQPKTTLILSGDIITNANIQPIVDFHQQKRAEFTVGVLEREDVSGAGILSFDQNNKVDRYFEKPTKPEEVFSHWVNGSIYFAEPTVTNYLPPLGTSADFSHDLFPAMVAKKAGMYAFPLPANQSYLIGIDSPELLKQVESDILSGKVFNAKKN